IQMWEQGEWPDFCDMLPEYASKGHGEGFMHDTAMLLGALGWNHYDRGVEVVTPFFPSSGTGQINAVFPVSPMPQALADIGRPRAAALAGGRL
ncbi:MAG: 3,4-dihydroxyphenylacetate 2,3-dioxygenase, partial [Bradyrhizobium sp.]|nr:3,4-dihydroxyphenylacetate 2,3-dioxygenase [Bradyrhizobium sp.]